MKGQNVLIITHLLKTHIKQRNDILAMKHISRKQIITKQTFQNSRPHRKNILPRNSEKTYTKKNKKLKIH